MVTFQLQNRPDAANTQALSDAPADEPAGKHLLTLSSMQRFKNVLAFISLCDIYICRTFISVLSHRLLH